MRVIIVLMTAAYEDSGGIVGKPYLTSFMAITGMQGTVECSQDARRVNTHSQIKHWRTPLTDDNEHLADPVGARGALASPSLLSFSDLDVVAHSSRLIRSISHSFSPLCSFGLRPSIQTTG